MVLPELALEPRSLKTCGFQMIVRKSSVLGSSRTLRVPWRPSCAFLVAFRNEFRPVFRGGHLAVLHSALLNYSKYKGTF